MLRNLKNKKGFTLVELIIVIVIIAILIAIAIPAVARFIENANRGVHQADAKTLYACTTAWTSEQLLRSVTPGRIVAGDQGNTGVQATGNAVGADARTALVAVQALGNVNVVAPDTLTFTWDNEGTVLTFVYTQDRGARANFVTTLTDGRLVFSQ
jgi:type IV pilus assembly protein PilA